MNILLLNAPKALHNSGSLCFTSFHSSSDCAPGTLTSFHFLNLLLPCSLLLSAGNPFLLFLLFYLSIPTFVQLFLYRHMVHLLLLHDSSLLRRDLATHLMFSCYLILLTLSSYHSFNYNIKGTLLVLLIAKSPAPSIVP